MPEIDLIAAVLFVLAIVHTFCASAINRVADRHPRHAGLLHLLGEVEVVFGLWSVVLVCAIAALQGVGESIAYLERLSFTEPMFVFVVMVIAATRPVLHFARRLIDAAVAALPLPRAAAFHFCSLALIPLLGSLITEAAAMTLAALLLRERLAGDDLSVRLKYATLGVLFVNVSIGGTLTTFAAPPVLMVARPWNWDNLFMLQNFGWKAALAVAFNAALCTFLFRHHLREQGPGAAQGESRPVPSAGVVATHLLFLGAVVVAAHHPIVFMGLLLFFLGFTQAWPKAQDRLILREALLVAFFLAGLVVLGAGQRWWLQPLLGGMSAGVVYYAALVLTAFTDNAALTYLGSLVEGLSEPFKMALVAGAVSGGGLTIIANAPNPAGNSILRGSFGASGINPLYLLVAALPPTLVAVLAFRVL